MSTTPIATVLNFFLSFYSSFSNFQHAARQTETEESTASTDHRSTSTRPSHHMCAIAVAVHACDAPKQTWRDWRSVGVLPRHVMHGPATYLSRWTPPYHHLATSSDKALGWDEMRWDQALLVSVFKQSCSHFFKLTKRMKAYVVLLSADR
jgi:hypothetical protein